MEIAVTEKEELQHEERRINKRLHAIRDAERHEANRALVGKTFRYHNNYSCPEKPRDYWWIYAKVQKCAKDGYLTVFMFETDKYGAVRIRTEKYMNYMSDGYQPIAPAKFAKAWRDLQRKIGITKP